MCVISNAIANISAMCKDFIIIFFRLNFKRSTFSEFLLGNFGLTIFFRHAPPPPAPRYKKLFCADFSYNIPRTSSYVHSIFVYFSRFSIFLLWSFFRNLSELRPFYPEHAACLNFFCATVTFNFLALPFLDTNRAIGPIKIQLRPSSIKLGFSHML